MRNVRYTKNKLNYIIIVGIIVFFMECSFFYRNIKLKNYLLRELKNEKDVRLFLRNRTDFYFQKRKKFLKDHNFEYIETELKTFQQKLFNNT